MSHVRPPGQGNLAVVADCWAVLGRATDGILLSMSGDR